MIPRNRPIYTILIGLFLLSNSFLTQAVLKTDTIPVVDSALYKKFFITAPRPLIIYADTLILVNEALPFIVNKSRFDSVALTPPLFEKRFLSLEEYYLPDKIFSDKYNRNYAYKKVYNNILDNHKELIKFTKAGLEGEAEKIVPIKSNILQYLLKIEYDKNAATKVDKPRQFYAKKYWFWKGNHFLQLSQTGNSGTWNNAGLGSINFLNTHSFNGNYQKNKLKLTQTLEWRLNLANNPSDSLRSYKISEDRFRSYTTAGFQAYKNWNYSSNLEFSTQFLPNFVENGRNRVSSFLSPFNVNAGIGMNFTLNNLYPNKKYPKLPGRTVAFVADISPLSVQYVNLLKGVTNPSKYGIKEGSSLLNFGTTLNTKLTVNFNNHVSYMTRTKYFTNYHRTDLEWEHDLNLPINRYFSMRLYFFVVFDDARAKDPTFGYVQINETFSFGFNYAW